MRPEFDSPTGRHFLEVGGVVGDDGYGRYQCSLLLEHYDSCLLAHLMSSRSHLADTLLQTPKRASHEVLLQQVAKAFDKGDYRFHPGDKGLFSRLTASTAMRFKLKGKIREHWHKAYIMIQVLLSKDDRIKTNYNFAQDSKIIMKKAVRIAELLIKVCLDGGSGITLRNAIELSGAISGGSWHEGEGPLRQIIGIGGSYASSLFKLGIDTVEKFTRLEPQELELSLKRNPPFGHQILAACRSVPRITLECNEQEEGKILDIKCTSFAGSEHTFHLLVIAKKTEYDCLLYEKVIGESIFNKKIPIANLNYKEITISWMSSTFAGINIHKVIETDDDDVSKMIEDDDVRKESFITFNHDSTMMTCKHQCKRKDICKHECCKQGIKKKRKKLGHSNDSRVNVMTTESRIQRHQEISNWLSTFRHVHDDRSCPVKYGGTPQEAFLNYMKVLSGETIGKGTE